MCAFIEEAGRRREKELHFSSWTAGVTAALQLRRRRPKERLRRDIADPRRGRIRFTRRVYTLRLWG